MDSDPPSPASSISSKENIPLFTQHEDVPRVAKKRRLQKKGDPKATEEVGARLRALRGLTNGATVGGEEISEAERGIFEGLLGKLHEEDSGESNPCHLRRGQLLWGGYYILKLREDGSLHEGRSVVNESG